MSVSKQDLVTLFVGDNDESNSNDPVARIVAPDSLSNNVVFPRVGLSWNINGVYDFIVIERKTTGEYSELATVAGDSVMYDDETIEAATTYTYRIHAIAGEDISTNSNETVAEVPA